MPMSYRRHRGLSPPRAMAAPSTTLNVHPDPSLVDHQRSRGVSSASQKTAQTLWLALLLYTFFGLPVLGRVLHFVRFVHGFSALKILQGLLAGGMQDVAIFLQTSTCLWLVKVVVEGEQLTAQDWSTGPTARPFPTSGFLRDHSASARFLPVYMPVLATEYDGREERMETVTGPGPSHHRTLLSLGAGGRRPSVRTRAKRALHALVIVALLQLILLVATMASVADFGLQVTRRPRLTRAYVTLFFKYLKHFTASLMDENVMTRTVVGSGAVYFALMAALTYGFYTGRLPLASDFLRRPSALCCCFGRRYNARKDSMASTNLSAVTTPGSYVSNLFTSYWHRAGKTIRSRRRSGQNYCHLQGGNGSGFSTQLASGSSLSSPGVGFNSKSGPLTVLGHCILASLLMTGAALSASLLIDGKGGVDMKRMNNAMFTLQSEQFFYRPRKIHREEINCTTASSVLQSTLGVSEKYELDGLGNDDHCALLWRKTIGYEGDNLFELDLNMTAPVTAASEVAENSTANANDGSKAARPTKAQPNIIVLNMESWRHLDVGVLGGAAKKETFGKSATPRFDELAKTGVLYSKHYTPCVQTSRTLLTTLFGMLPSCTETAALKQYSTTLNVRGLPHFLKQRGYFNLFWSAVDLTWEYWDKFLLKNGFDKLVDDRKVRKMLHETRNYKNKPDDHYSWGIHDHLSFEMLLYAIESAHNASVDSNDAAIASSVEVNADNRTFTNATEIGGMTTVLKATVEDAANLTTNGMFTSATLSENVSTTIAATPTMPRLPGWEGMQTPYFIDMYSITSHSPWALPSFYDAPDLSGLYTRYNKKYLDSMCFSDEMLGDFIAALRAKGLMKNTIVIIEGDYGYGVERDTNPSVVDSGVWDEVSKVPFLLLADDFLRDEDKGKVVSQLSTQSDLMATIADILGVTPDEPLYQHGYGHSMKRRRSQLEAQTEAQALGIKTPKDKVAQPKDKAPAESPQERRVILCNPFTGMSKGVRTEELKYIFHPDGSFNVFEPAIDPTEKKPLQTGFDIEEMDDATHNMFEDVTKAVDLNQFLFVANRFVTPLATPLVMNGTTSTTISNDVEPQELRRPPAPINSLD